MVCGIPVVPGPLGSYRERWQLAKARPACACVVRTSTRGARSSRSPCDVGAWVVWVPLVTPTCLWLCQCCEDHKIKQGVSISASPRVVIDVQNGFQACDDEVSRGSGKMRSVGSLAQPMLIIESRGCLGIILLGQTRDQAVCGCLPSPTALRVSRGSACFFILSIPSV